jgi:hypothetical protein
VEPRDSATFILALVLLALVVAFAALVVGLLAWLSPSTLGS